MLLGCIGDDFTGSSDLANMLAKGRMRTLQYTRVPERDAPPDVEAAVVSLKTRTCPADQAITASLAALEWLQRQGCRHFYFKYCSTFDSTPNGNIGPVADALLDRLGLNRAIICPAFPDAGRTLYNGHLFVGDRLLNESGMENHPLTPMTDPDIRRWLARQSRYPVGHIPHARVAAGPAAIRTALDEQARSGRRLIVADAIHDEDLTAIASSTIDHCLMTGGSGLGLGLAAHFQAVGLLQGGFGCDWVGTPGPAAILSGSCSAATRRQIARHAAAGHPTFAIDAEEVVEGGAAAERLVSWFAGHSGALPLAYSSAEPVEVAQMQERYGRERVADALEAFFAEIAKVLAREGVTRLIVAGGETSGAVVRALDAEVLEVGPEIDVGIPALKVGGTDLCLALKSGNFGSNDFFEKAAGMMEGT